MNDIITNYRIKSAQVKIVNYEGKPPFVLNISDAIRLAEDSQKDLIQVTYDAKSDMAICEIMELGKYKYLKQKKQAPQINTSVKEFKFGLNIEEHDIDTKIKHALELMDKKHPAKIIVFLRNWQKDQMPKAQELYDSIVTRLGTNIVEQSRKKTEKQIFGTYVKKEKS